MIVEIRVGISCKTGDELPVEAAHNLKAFEQVTKPVRNAQSQRGTLRPVKHWSNIPQCLIVINLLELPLQLLQSFDIIGGGHPFTFLIFLVVLIELVVWQIVIVPQMWGQCAP